MFMKVCIISKQVSIIQHFNNMLLKKNFDKYNITEVSVNKVENKNNSNYIYLISDDEELFLNENSIKSFKVLIGKVFNPNLYYKYHFDYYLCDIFNVDDLEKMLQTYQIRKSKKDKIIFHSNYKIFQIRINDVFFIEKRDRKTYVYTVDGILSVRDNFSELKSYLSSYGFIVPHYSFLVNSYYIVSICDSKIILKNNTVIPISRSNKSKLSGL